ncbi:MAG TPA: hypothetical protein VMV72_04325 [Verrucomicrobiae bacterium]|nr:hypothetical protein [Verrucomicrobiae bacterium]
MAVIITAILACIGGVVAEERGFLTNGEVDKVTMALAVGAALLVAILNLRRVQEYNRLSPAEQLEARPTEEQANRSRRRARSLQIVLLILLLAVTVLIILAHAVGHASPPLRAVAPAIFGAVVAGLMLFLQRKGRTSDAGLCTLANNEAVALLQAGKVSDAAEALDKVVAEHTIEGSFRSLVAWNRGVAHLRLGNTAVATASFEDALGSLGRWSGGIRSSVWCCLALSHAIAGDLEMAARIQKQIQVRRRKRTSILARFAGAFIHVCKAQYPDAIESARTDGADPKRVRSTHEWRAARLLAAFSLARMAPRDDRVSEFVKAATPTYPGEFDYLAKSLPELRLFLVEHGFSTARAAL